MLSEGSEGADNLITVLVCGGRRFNDRKLLERSLNAVHVRRPITTLITGNQAGVEEMSYWWAAVDYRKCRDFSHKS